MDFIVHGVTESRTQLSDFHFQNPQSRSSNPNLPSVPYPRDDTIILQIRQGRRTLAHMFDTLILPPISNLSQTILLLFSLFHFFLLILFHSLLLFPPPL